MPQPKDEMHFDNPPRKDETYYFTIEQWREIVKANELELYGGDKPIIDIKKK